MYFPLILLGSTAITDRGHTCAHMYAYVYTYTHDRNRESRELKGGELSIELFTSQRRAPFLKPFA